MQAIRAHSLFTANHIGLADVDGFYYHLIETVSAERRRQMRPEKKEA